MSNYKIYIKDAKNLASFIEPESVDLLISDPPYYNEVVYSQDAGQLSAASSYPDFLKAIAEVWQACAKVLKPGAVVALSLHDFFRVGPHGHNYVAFHDDIARSFPSEMALRCIWIWDRYLNRDKGAFPPGPVGTRYMYVLVLQKLGIHSANHELIRRSLEKSYWEPVWHKKTSPKFFGSEKLFKAGFYLLKPFGSRLKSIKKRFNNSVAIKDPHILSDYTTKCPEEVVRRLMNDYSLPGNTVLDPFLGSGTVMKIAKETGRSCLGVEINPLALPVIKKKVGLDSLDVVV